MLIIVIAAIGLLAVAAASFAQVTRSQVKAAAGAVGTSTAASLANAGVQLAVLDLVRARQDPGHRRRFTIGDKPFMCDAGDGQRLVIAITDEAGKVDLNAANDRLLQALLAGLGVEGSQAIADAILDFRDDDSERRARGAERTEYAAAGRPGPKNAPFSAIEEIEQVLGVDGQLAALLRPHITVYTGQAGVDEASASRTLTRILAKGFGNEPANSEGDTDDQADQTVRPRNPAMLAQGRRFFGIHSEAYTGATVFVREAVVELGQSRNRPYTFLRWYRGVLNGGLAPAPDTAPPPC